MTSREDIVKALKQVPAVVCEYGKVPPTLACLRLPGEHVCSLQSPPPQPCHMFMYRMTCDLLRAASRPLHLHPVDNHSGLHLHGAASHTGSAPGADVGGCFGLLQRGRLVKKSWE